MASSTYGRKLNPYRRLRDPLGVKGVRQSVVVTNNPSSIDQNQQLLVRFPNLGAHDVVVPGTARLAFTVSLTSTDANRTIVKNVGRAVVKKTTIKISGNEVLSIDDSDVLHCYQDLWKTAQERRNSQYQGIDLSDDSNVTRIRVGAGNKDETETEDAAIAAAFGNRYHVPLDFELVESHMPFYQSALGDRLEYELTFNDYSRVVVATGDAAASYSIDNIALEFDMVTQPDLARQIRNQFAGRLAVLYERVLRHRKITANKSDTLWNINLNVPARSMSGILMLFEEPAAAFQRDTEAFCNPKIEKVEVCIEGIPNQLYSQGMRAYQLWGEARKHFAAGTKRHPEVAAVAKDLALADVSLGQFLTSKHALWLDLRTTDDDQLNGSGRLWLLRSSPLSSRISTFNSTKVPPQRRLNSGFGMLTVWMSPKAWRPIPTLVRRVDWALSTKFFVVFSWFRCTWSDFVVVKLTGRSPSYAPLWSHRPPRPSSKPRSVSSPFVIWTSHPFVTVSVSSPFNLFVDIAILAILADLSLAASSRSLMRSSIP